MNTEQAKNYVTIRKELRKMEKNERKLKKNARDIFWSSVPISEALFEVAGLMGLVGIIGLLATFGLALRFNGYTYINNDFALINPYLAFSAFFLVLVGMAFLFWYIYEIKRSQFYEAGLDE